MHFFKPAVNRVVNYSTKYSKVFPLLLGVSSTGVLAGSIFFSAEERRKEVLSELGTSENIVRTPPQVSRMK